MYDLIIKESQFGKKDFLDASQVVFNYSSSIPQLIHIFFDWISNHVKL